MDTYRFALLGTSWMLWMAPFFRLSRPKTAQTVDRRARWGILIEGLAYAIVWAGPFWLRPKAVWEAVLATVFFAIAIVISWGATRALGKQWRIEAGLNPDHELVRSGPYRFVRHPIYASMLCMLLGTGFDISTLWQIAVAVVVFVIGTEIRVRVEDGLLESRFGETFREYQRSVAGYIPGIR